MFIFYFCMFAFCFVYSVHQYYFVYCFSPLYNCLFYICVHFYRTLPPGVNSIAVNKYRITSYITMKDVYVAINIRCNARHFKHTGLQLQPHSVLTGHATRIAQDSTTLHDTSACRIQNLKLTTLKTPMHLNFPPV